MKACVLEGIDKLVYKDVPTPVPSEGEVLIRIKASGICSSDFPRVKKTGTYHFPTIPGHEFAGEIVRVGKNVDSSLIGQHAIVFPLLPCRECSSCSQEHWAQCKNYNYFGSRCDGGFAEYLAAPLWNIKIFSNNIPFSVAALAEPAAVAWHAVSIADIKNGDTVCISGSGPIAILCGLWAKEQSASQVFLTCRNQKKADFIETHFGLKTLSISEKFEDSLKLVTSGEGADVVLECVGTNTSFENSLRIVRQRGTLVLVGNPAGNMTLTKQLYWKILRSELVIKGSWNSIWRGSPCDWDEVLHRFEIMHEVFTPLITHKYSFDECNIVFLCDDSSNDIYLKRMFIND